MKSEGRRSWIRASAQVQCGSGPHERRRAGSRSGQGEARRCAADTPTKLVGAAEQAQPTRESPLGRVARAHPAWPWAAVPRRVRTSRVAMVFHKGKSSHAPPGLMSRGNRPFNPY